MKKVISALMGKNTVNLPYSGNAYTFENKGSFVVVPEAEAKEFEKMNGFLVVDAE